MKIARCDNCGSVDTGTKGLGWHGPDGDTAVYLAHRVGLEIASIRTSTPEAADLCPACVDAVQAALDNRREAAAPEVRFGATAAGAA